MSNQFFHGSKKLFPAGFLLSPQIDGYANQDEVKNIEAYLEARRPPNKTARSKSVFLVNDPDLIDSAGGYIDAIYKVIPRSTPEESDLAWYSEALCALDTDPSDMDYVAHCADMYWDGTPFFDDSRRCPEFRVKWAEVASMFELNVERHELERISGAPSHGK